MNRDVEFHPEPQRVLQGLYRAFATVRIAAVVGLRDAKGRPLAGSKTYRIHIPPKIPAKRFWDITVYDNMTRSMLQVDDPYPAVTSIDESVVQNDDGTWDVYFGPERPDGADNWIQTIPGKGWNMLFRLYGPLKPFFDKTWRPSEIELVE